jgi:hypothetical protein
VSTIEVIRPAPRAKVSTAELAALALWEAEQDFGPYDLMDEGDRA